MGDTVEAGPGVWPGHRKPPPAAASAPASLHILGRLGGWMLGARLGGERSGVRVRGMLARVCPGSEMDRENLMSRVSPSREPCTCCSPSLSMAA